MFIKRFMKLSNGRIGMWFGVREEKVDLNV